MRMLHTIHVTCTALVLVLVTVRPNVALENGLARTPPMGWISWQRFTCNTDCAQFPDDCISSKLYRDKADRMVADGYAEVGYKYVNIDDCWSEMEREPASANLVANASSFPEGIKELANYVHSKGLKLGIYGDCGTKTCAGYPAQLKSETNLETNYFELDARQLASWQVDSLKFDGCHLDPARAESICPKMANAIAANNRTILVTCEWPFYMLREKYQLKRNLSPNFKIAQEACNAWRYYEDIEDSWLSVLSIIDFTIRIQDTVARYHGPGHWFDPDVLVVGNFALSLDQARAQMAIWCIWSAPLYMSHDHRNVRPEMAAVLKNKPLIEVNQDALGVLGMMVVSQENERYQAFVKPVFPFLNGCPSFVVVYLSRQTLGDKRYVSFELRNLLQGVDYDLVASRDNVNAMSCESCRQFIKLAMTRDPADGELLIRPVDAQDLPMEHTQVHYAVTDLFEDDPSPQPVALNGKLKLKVNPSGVRAVKLTQI